MSTVLKYPVHTIYSYTGACVFYSIFTITKHTCQWNELPRDNNNILATAPSSRYNYTGPRIDCIWHKNVPAYISYYIPTTKKQKHVWMQHPSWHMRPIHISLKWAGVDCILGSTGNDGQRALNDLADKLRTGNCSTMFAVDGPAGPAHVMKRGCLDLAKMTGVPCVGIEFEYSRSVRLPGSWDKKHYAIPFSVVKIKETEPIWVTEDNYEESRQKLVNGLG